MLLVAFLALLWPSTSWSSNVVHNVTAVSGVAVDLRCDVKLRRCGNFHSIEWYREFNNEAKAERVYVYRHNSGRGKAENAWRDRAQHVYEARRRRMIVSLAPSRLEDEGFYRCEITYENLDGNGRWFDDEDGGCLAPQLARLTLLERPKFARIELKNGTRLTANGARDGVPVIGPFNEGAVLVLRCRAGGGKPIPQVIIFIE